MTERSVTASASAFVETISALEAKIEGLLGRLEALERERIVRDAPLALLSVRELARRHPGFTEQAIRALVKRRHRNGLRASGAIIRQGRRVLFNERRFVAWAEGMVETAPPTPPPGGYSGSCSRPYAGAYSGKKRSAIRPATASRCESVR